MTLATSDGIPIAAEHPSGLAQGTAAERRAARRARAPLVRRFVFSAAVWALYVPHLALLRILGPRLGPAWARMVGRIHWLLSYVGAQRSARRVLEAVHPHLQTRLSVSAILRKHLELKHECFARIKVLHHAKRGAVGDDLVWEVDPSSAATFNEHCAPGQGLMLVGFHFGFFRLSAKAIPAVFPSCNAVQISHRTAHYTGEAFDAVAQLALQKSLVADRQSGARIHYVGPGSSVIRLFRLLTSGGTAVVTADGAFAKDFLDVPFLGGKLRMPCGWARLAATTRSNVLILLDTKLDAGRRRAWIFEHVQLHGDESPAAIHNAVAATARILEEFVRREPWSWHPWQRIRIETTDDGSPVLILSGLGDDQNELAESVAASEAER